MADQEWNRGGGIACGFEVMGENCQSSSPLLRHLHTCKKKLPSFLPCGEKLQRIHTTERIPEENVLKREDDIPAASLIIRSVPFWLGMEQNWTFLQVRSTILGFH